MHIIEIKADANGAHRNQEYNGSIPPHWEGVAFIREDVSTLENFPFGTPTVEEINGVMTVTAWTPGELPPTDNTIEITTQIDSLKAQLSATDYKIIKCSEAQLVGEELPYNIEELHTERQAIRNQINELEAQLGEQGSEV